MALNGVFDLSQTPASNVDFLGTSVLGTGLVSTADDSFRNLASFLARWRDDLGGVAVTSGTNTLTVTANQAFAAYATGQRYLFKLGGTNTGAATLNITPSGGAALGAKNIKVLVAGVATDPTAGQLTSGNYAEFQYDGTNMNLMASGLPAATNAQAATASSTTVALTPANLAQERGYSNASFSDLSFTCTVAASALTIAIKGQDGNDPSATNPVYISFRSATLTSGANAQLTLTAATSLVIPSTATMGFTSAVIGKIWIVGFNDAGTFRLGVVNCLSGTSIFALADGIYSATATPASSAQVIYSNAAVTSKAMTVLGYLEATEATAGTWATAPSTVQVRTPSTPLPGTPLQVAETITGAVATGTTTVPADDTIPQITEGTEFMTQAITPRSSANLLQIEHVGNYANGTGTVQNIASLFQDATANALATGVMTSVTLNLPSPISVRKSVLAGTTSSTTFRIRCGPSAASTVTFNGITGGRLYGGVFNSILRVTEIVA